MITKAATDVVSTLASFSILKSLSDEEKYKSPYQILREFITYIVCSESLRTFSAVEIKNFLTEYFEFNIPEAVVKTALKRIDGVTLTNGEYSANLSEINSISDFEKKKKEADEYTTSIIQLLSKYISEKGSGLSTKEEILTQKLADFLIEDHPDHANEYTEIIGEFILKNEKNEDIQRGLNKIREGSILYIGLSHNIGEIGSITKTLSLYLSTEILSSLAGYNGSVYQQFANDFYDQVCSANVGGKKNVTLYYFSETKEEIDNFFYAAKQIVNGQKIDLLKSPAMSEITNGCKTSTDVDIKQSDFYYKLHREYGIKEDPHDNYYGEDMFSTNLESWECGDETDGKNKKEMALKFVSHINKLRNGECPRNDIESEYLIVTNAKTTLLISKEQSDRIKNEKGLESICNFAVSMDRITSLLWYKLGKGFSKKQFPKSIAALLKARIVLSSSIAKNAEKVFSDVKNKYQAGEIEADQVAARIITIRNKMLLPENLQPEDIDEIMDFSPEYLRIYEEQVKQTRKKLEEKDKLIEDIKEEKDRQNFERNAQIASKNEVIENQKEENERLCEELNQYKQIVEDDNAKKAYRKNVVLFVWSILWKAIAIIIISWLITKLESYPNLKFLKNVLIAIDALATICALFSVVKKDRRKYFPKDRKKNRKDDHKNHHTDQKDTK